MERNKRMRTNGKLYNRTLPKRILRLLLNRIQQHKHNRKRLKKMNNNIKETLMHIKGLNQEDFKEIHRLIQIEYRQRLR
jgi:cell shape-determining protein MreC